MSIDLAEHAMDDVEQDTIALLYEEVARLEAELRQRSEPAPEAAPASADAAASEGRISALTAELASRDEAIGLLWDQVGRLEEAEAAGRAESEQLQRWIEEIERRVEGQDSGESDLRHELEAERARAETQRREVELDRRSWDSQRRDLEGEIALLKARLDGPAHDDPADGALSILQRENARLRTIGQQALAEIASLRGELQGAQAERDEARRHCRATTDDLERERREHQAELAELRSRTARESARSTGGELTPDDRMRALRQHLQEIHQRDEDERKGRQLSNRLARLWRRTGPR